MVDNFPKLMTDTKPQIQEVQRHHVEWKEKTLHYSFHIQAAKTKNKNKNKTKQKQKQGDLERSREKKCIEEQG